ncbi:hypothetical protein BC832DRAFT_589355 [Gaertneriomyces semiglobifer]|nr:hypothetical protein BC832DRAFT_589355 [Gaertneriomyces semiglobifer]
MEFSTPNNTHAGETSRLDIIGGVPLPACPYKDSELDGFHNPTASLTFLLIGVTAITFAIIVAASYDSATVFNRRIRDKSLRNGWWAAHFLVIGISFVIDAIRYSLNLPFTISEGDHKLGSERRKETTVAPEVIDAWLLLVSVGLRSFAVFTTTLALDHQRKYRSSAIRSNLCVDTSNAGAQGGGDESGSTSSGTNSPFTSLPASHPGSSPGASSTRDFEDIEVQEDYGVETAVGGSSRSGHKRHRQRAVSFGGELDEEVPLLAAHDNQHIVRERPKWYKRAMPGEDCWGLYETLRKIVCNWTSTALLLWIMNLIAIYLVTNPPVVTPETGLIPDIPLSFPPRLANPGPPVLSNAVLYWSVVMNLIQHIPILIIAAFIIFGASEERPFVGSHQSRRHAQRQQHGPSLTARTMLLFALLLGMVWWVEPSIMSRGIDSVIKSAMASDDSLSYEGRMCAVPPWWWLEIRDDDESPMSLVPKPPMQLHGWASWVDLFQWAGYASLWLTFAFVRNEYKRNKEEWVWATVSELQNIFDFRRY